MSEIIWFLLSITDYIIMVCSHPAVNKVHSPQVECFDNGYQSSAQEFWEVVKKRMLRLPSKNLPSVLYMPR